MTSPGTLRFFDRLNPLFVGLLHAPLLHRALSAGLMTVSTQGHKSGRKLCFPVGYHDQGDAVLVMVSQAAERQWWRNFRSPWPATLRVRGEAREVLGEVLSSESEEYARRVGRNFSRAAFIPRLFDIDFDAERGLTPEQVEQLAGYAAVVRFVPA
ncbi:MAG: nitroreductase/quinone reductase family protein [Myxococcota bacterium]